MDRVKIEALAKRLVTLAGQQGRYLDYSDAFFAFAEKDEDTGGRGEGGGAGGWGSWTWNDMAMQGQSLTVLIIFPVFLLTLVASLSSCTSVTQVNSSPLTGPLASEERLLLRGGFMQGWGTQTLEPSFQGLQPSSTNYQIWDSGKVTYHLDLLTCEMEEIIVSSLQNYYELIHKST